MDPRTQLIKIMYNFIPMNIRDIIARFIYQINVNNKNMMIENNFDNWIYKDKDGSYKIIGDKELIPIIIIKGRMITLRGEDRILRTGIRVKRKIDIEKLNKEVDIKFRVSSKDITIYVDLNINKISNDVKEISLHILKDEILRPINMEVIPKYNEELIK